MRAKNEFKFLAEAYNTKLILERVVDGKLMCPEACCGAPVVECTCGPDCPHCNCFMIHKAMKEKGFTNKLLKEGVEEDEPYGILDATVRDFEQELDIQGDGIDTNVNELKDYVDIIKTLDIDERQRESALDYLMNLRGPGGRAGLEDVDFEFVFGIEDNESYEHKTDALVAAGTTKSEDINEIDLNKWREYPAEDVMKAVYRRYGKELPSVDSYDWAITWDKKVRPWLKENEGNL